MQEEEEENQRRQRQHVQTSSSSNINTNSSSQQTSQNQAGQHQHQHQAPIQQQHHYTTSTDKSHIDRTTNSGTDFPSSSSAAAGTSAAYGASTGHSVGETGIDIRGIEPNQSLLPEHAFHQSYSAAFNAFSTNPEYATAAQGAFGNGGNDQGLNVMLQYASNSIDQDSFSVHQQ